jgi:hypothetical protein
VSGDLTYERATPLDFTCPRCQAAPVEPCASPRLKARAHGHAPRVDRANTENTHRHLATWNARYATGCDELNHRLGTVTT